MKDEWRKNLIYIGYVAVTDIIFCLLALLYDYLSR